MKYFKALVVGGGLAGMRAAVAFNMKNISVGLLSKVHPLRSHSIEAQGGINAALGNHPRGKFDSPKLHGYDTVKGSDYLADQPAVLKFTGLAPFIVRQMESWGVPFSRTPEGKIAQRPFGGAGFPRTCYAADKTGHVLLHTMWEQVVKYKTFSERDNMQVFDEWMATRLIVDAGKAVGVIAMNIQTGEIEAFMAEAIVWATGGMGRIFKNTTNSLINTGLGMAIPYWAGVPLKDMEFVQYHPTTLLGPNILMTEGCRGEGGYLINKNGERFLANYPDSSKSMEISPRDIVSRNIQREIDKGNGGYPFAGGVKEGDFVGLDLRHLGEEKIQERLPAIREISINFAGVDPAYEPIPIQPGAHYAMGGLDTNENGQAPEVEGFYAAGEAGCASVHGANRLGGNSLLETLVFGKITGEHAADYIQTKETSVMSSKGYVQEVLEDEKNRLDEMKNRNGNEKHATINDELQETMRKNVWIFRDEEHLKVAYDKIQELKERFKNIGIEYKGKVMNYDLIWALEVQGNLSVAEAVVAGALNRKESRGAHFRLEYTKRDDPNYLKHTIARWDGEKAKLDWKDVELGIWEPKERKY